MSSSNQTKPDQSRAKTRSVVFALIGVAALVFKRYYAGPLEGLVLAYGGNVVVSFAVYFIVAPTLFAARYRILLNIGIALLAVELFEATNGFGVMSNVFDRGDYIANIVGVGLAVAVDLLSRRIAESREKTKTAT